ncbi:MFS general substrate transporter [Lojkania enalia]|uniref:MFS general substrate transporter n=1 Tax=Lojkania enalia TaxID=147567 RepID=A0A9P4K6G4_9PLEO|nr:MFS general substrate transporter [Didymosphaeria enalia]
MADDLDYSADAGAHVPGTVHLVDLLGTMHARHAQGGEKDIVLVPAPSDDPDDPLNWSPRRKALSTLCMCVYTLMVGIASAAIYSVLEPISEETGLTLDDLNQGTGYMFLFFGWGCLIWQPLALQYGKRPVYLVSILATLATQDLLGPPIESLCEISVTDIYFTHERGRYIGLYALLLAGSNFFAPIIAGFINDGMGWQWGLYWCAIFCGIGFIFLFLFMEETNYVRHTAGAPISSPGTATPVDPADPEKFAPSRISAESNEAPLHKRKTYLNKLKLFQQADLEKPNEFIGMITRPLIIPHLPLWFNVLNATASLILGGTYNFSPSMVGLAYVSPLLGVAIGSAYTGVLGDWWVIRKARKNNGIMESEHRLWLFVPSLLCIPGGLILWGVGAAQGVHWFGPVFAMGVIAMTNTFGLQLSVAYCIDSYRALSGEAIVTVILVRNTMGFAIGYGITPWVTDMGLQNCFITAGFVGLAQVCTVAVMIRYGKELRKMSVPRYSKYVEQMARSGMVH